MKIHKWLKLSNLDLQILHRVYTYDDLIKVSNLIIFLIVLSRFDVWPLILGKIIKIMFHDKMIREIFRSKKDKMYEGLCTIHYNKFRDKNTAVNCRIHRWVGYLARMIEAIKAYGFLMRNLFENLHLGDWELLWGLR